MWFFLYQETSQTKQQKNGGFTNATPTQRRMRMYWGNTITTLFPKNKQHCCLLPSSSSRGSGNISLVAIRVAVRAAPLRPCRPRLLEAARALHLLTGWSIELCRQLRRSMTLSEPLLSSLTTLRGFSKMYRHLVGFGFRQDLATIAIAQ